MPFTVRVELHGADGDSYDELHEEMKARGLDVFIESKGVRFQLPSAEYNYKESATRQQVHDLAVEAAKAVGKRYWILVTESKGRLFTLDKAKDDDDEV